MIVIMVYYVLILIQRGLKMTRFNENRRFGVEMETVLKRGYSSIDLKFALEDQGLRVVRQGYGHDVDSDNTSVWKIKPDSSICGGEGAEVVSPVLKGSEGLRQVEIVCEVLGRMTDVNRSCGVHVHHESTDLSYKAFRNVYQIYKSSQKVIDGFLPKSRRAANRRSFVDDVYGGGRLYYDRAEALSDERFTRFLTRETSRYMVVNFRSYGLRGTIEFRQHSGSTEFKKIKSWIVFTQGIVEWAKARKQAMKAKDIARCCDLFYTIGWQGNDDQEIVEAKAYLEERFQYFKREERRVA